MDAVPATEPQTLGFGFSFADLASARRAGAAGPRLPRSAGGRGRGAARASAGGARRAGCARREGRRASWSSRSARISTGSSPTLFGIEAETLALAPRNPRARSDPRLQAAVRAAPGGEEIPRSVRRSTARRCARRWRRGSASALTERRVRRRVSRPGKRAGDGEALDLALRYAAWATLTAGGPRGASRQHAVPRAAPARLQPSGAGRNHRARRRARCCGCRNMTGAGARGLR